MCQHNFEIVLIKVKNLYIGKKYQLVSRCNVCGMIEKILKEY